MKFFKLFLLTCFASFFFFSFAHADGTPPAFGTSLAALISAVKVGAISSILLALGQLLKSDFVSQILGGAVNTKYLPWINTLIAVIIAVGTTLAQPGVPWYVGVIEGVISSLAAGGIFDHFKVGQA